MCGNGGSAADSEHIVGELMKSFLVRRPVPEKFVESLSAYGSEGAALADGLEAGLPAISLCGHPALSTAFLNDAEPTMTFAQQTAALGRESDVLLAISIPATACWLQLQPKLQGCTPSRLPEKSLRAFRK